MKKPPHIMTLETVDYTSEIADKISNIYSQKEKTQNQMRVETCDYLIKDLIGDKSGKELEPFLTNVSIDTSNGCVLIGLTFVPDQFRRQ